jgi:hypothetical protein
MNVKLFKDLAPDITRQRLVIEGYPGFIITDQHIKTYLAQLSKELAMKDLIEPVTHRSDQFGWAGWIHWETSGAHFYAWEQPRLFFSVDMYTCKAFDPERAVEFTKEFFQASTIVSIPFDINASKLISAQNETFESRYDMNEQEVKDTVGKYLSRPDLPRRRFVGISVRGDEPLSNIARWLEGQVFQDTFGHDTSEMVDMYGSVETDSTFLLVLDRRSKLPAGVMRLVGGNAAYTLTLAEASDYIPYSVEQIRLFHNIQEDEKAWDVATMAIAKPYRGKLFSQVAVSGMLERMFGMLGDQEGIVHVFTMLDAKARKSIDGVGIPFREMHGHPGAFQYKDSPATYALYGRYADFRISLSEKHYEVKSESIIRNVAKMGVKRALRRRISGKVAGMAAHGKGNVDRHIKID